MSRTHPEPVAVLFTMPRSHYLDIPGCDCYDEQRDARTFPGGMPVVAHPPCRLWGRLRHLSTAPQSEMELARWAVEVVKREGGVLEHPAGSTLWQDMGLPYPYQGDVGDRFTLEVEQFHWGHKCRKRTWLFVDGCPLTALPPMPRRLGRPTHTIDTKRRGHGHKPRVSHRERSLTPPAFAAWLVAVARKCRSREREGR